jgi:hypothetical protein
MTDCLNTVGFVFDKVKTYIKKDKMCRYANSYCQTCVITPSGAISPCNTCSNNSQYKVCIFKLKKQHFVSSTLGIASDKHNAWEQFKSNIIYQKNGNFVISVTDSCNRSHSFYANMIKAKKCSCCDAILLYFKYNIITHIPGDQIQYVATHPPDVVLPNSTEYPYIVACANAHSNITYNLKSNEYKTVRFFNSQNYSFCNGGGYGNAL